MRVNAAINLTVLAGFFLAVAAPSHLTLSAQQLFKNNMSPRDWVYPDVLKPRLKVLAGRDAINCGRASLSSLKATDVSDCALQAYASRKRFYARYDLESFDTVDTLGFAFDGRKVSAVIWQRMIGGAKQTLVVKDCPLPITLTKTRSGRLDCFPAEIKLPIGPPQL